MTPAQFEKVALWMGWRIKLIDGFRWWLDSHDNVVCATLVKTSLTDSEAVEALNRLVAKGYLYELKNTNKAHVCRVSVPVEAWYEDDVAETEAPTIPEAVAQAILALVEKEVPACE